MEGGGRRVERPSTSLTGGGVGGGGVGGDGGTALVDGECSGEDDEVRSALVRCGAALALALTLTLPSTSLTSFILCTWSAMSWRNLSTGREASGRSSKTVFLPLRDRIPEKHRYTARDPNGAVVSP